MNILGIGESVVDDISVVHHDEGSDAVELLRSHRDAGGPALAALVLLAKLGHDCSFVTTLGDDAEGRFIRRVLADANVRLVAHARPATKSNVIVVDAVTGRREKIRRPSPHTPLPALTPVDVRQFDCIIMDRHEREAFHQIVQHKALATTVITDPSTEVSAFTETMVRHSDCPIVPVEALAEMGRSLSEALGKLHSICQKTFIVTLGELGSLMYDGEQSKIIPSLEVKAVDTLGAGDVYRGAFAHGLAQGWSFAACAEFANTAAALQCTKHGNAAAVPSKADIARHLHHTPRRAVSLSNVNETFLSLCSHSIKQSTITTQASINVLG
jgi:sulfofructose kinase